MKTRFILMAALATIIPQKPFGECLSLSTAVDFANKDTNRLQGAIAQVLARRSPYISVLEGGTFPSGVSDTIKSVVQERAVLNHSLVKPAFVAESAICGTAGPVMQVGSTQFTETLGVLRGRGPRVCVRTTRSAFKGSYSSAEATMKAELIQLTNSDIRGNLVVRSGTKLVVKSTGTFEQMFTGGTNAIDTNFETAYGAPDTDLGFKLLKYARNFLKEDLLVEGWEGNDSDPVFRVIASQEQIEKFRDEIGIRDDHRSLTSGGFKLGETFIKGYTWEGPYRGFIFGIDSQPLRFDGFADGTTHTYPDGTLIPAGQPRYIEPHIAVNVTTGVGARINPAWAHALYEVTLLIGAGSFRRRTPEQLMGEGGFKWPGQLAQGTLEFVVQRDNDCNLFQDYGQHIYEITRSFRPERPHHVMAIAHKRCKPDFGMVACDAGPDYTNTSSL